MAARTDIVPSGIVECQQKKETETMLFIFNLFFSLCMGVGVLALSELRVAGC